MNLKAQKEHFKNHIAAFTDYGNIKILDFKNPNTSHYRIRFLFEEDYCRLHISGDLGELIATNYDNMTYESFSDFVNDTGYFEQKIDCHNRPIYTYDDDKAKADLLDLFKQYEVMAADFEDAYLYDDIEDVIDYILEDFDYNSGLGSKSYEIISSVISDAWEFTGDIGKVNTGILDLYMLAFKLAQKQLDERK